MEREQTEELTTVTDDMIDDINKLLTFLRKSNLAEEVKYFYIKQPQKSEEWHEERRIRLTGSLFKTYIHATPTTRMKIPFENFHKVAK